jgi:hypothetical protein
VERLSISLSIAGFVGGDEIEGASEIPSPDHQRKQTSATHKEAAAKLTHPNAGAN